MKTYSDYFIHKTSDKLKLYKQDQKVWWSGELNRWMCADATIIKDILNNRKFVVSSFSAEKITSRLSVNLEHSSQLLKYFPLAQENELHTHIRKRHALQLAKNSKVALQSFKEYFEHKLHSLISPPPSATNLYDDLLLPSANVLLGALAEIDYSPSSYCYSLSQVFDETLPLSIRVKLEQRLGELIDSLPQHLDQDEKYFRASVMALGTDSLLGTLAESLLSILQMNEGKSLSEIAWPDDVPATGVPVLERILTDDCEIDGQLMKNGHRVRLYLDAAGYAETETPSYSQLYFGAGRHLCPGMSIGRQAWKIMVDSLKKIDKKIHLQEFARRENDNVFNLYNLIKVNFYD